METNQHTQLPPGTIVQIRPTGDTRECFHHAKGVVLNVVDVNPGVDPSCELRTIELYQEEFDRLKKDWGAIPRDMLMFVKDLEEIPDPGLTRMSPKKEFDYTEAIRERLRKEQEDKPHSVHVTRAVRVTYRDALGQVQGVAYDEPVITTVGQIQAVPMTGDEVHAALLARKVPRSVEIDDILKRQIDYIISVLENLIPAAEEGLRNAQSDAGDGVEGAHIVAFEYMSTLREATHLVEQLKKGEPPSPLTQEPNEAE